MKRNQSIACLLLHVRRLSSSNQLPKLTEHRMNSQSVIK